MNYDEIRNKYKGQASERQARLNHLNNQLDAKRNEERRIEREIHERLSGRYDYETAQAVQSLRFELKEAQEATAKALDEFNKFNGGDVIASVVDNMKL